MNSSKLCKGHEKILSVSRIILFLGLLVSSVNGQSLTGENASGSDGDFWSLRPLGNPKLPKTRGSDINPIDRFVSARIEGAGIVPVQEARPTVLLRRAYFDLIGLPPSLTEQKDFGLGGETTYEALVDRLLASERFGERWARYWLDVARYAESAGFEMDHDRPYAWRYRDFVISAMNDDMPYDEFVSLQIAGDHLRPDDPQALIATGFVVAGVENLIQSRKDFVRQRYDKIDDMVGTVCTAMLGFSVSCARCHDHKHDPITQREYYRIAAAFGSTVSKVKEVGAGENRSPAYVASESLDGKIHMVVVTEPSFLDLPKIPARVHFLERGDPELAEDVARLGFPSVLTRGQGKTANWFSKDEGVAPGRMVLARWITDTKHGAGELLARVIVNRLWHHHFGRGLVATPNDFGLHGDRPSHPELLDWLARELIEGGWKLKPIHKLIMMSATYRRGYGDASEVVGAAADPDNRLLWRREPRRLDAEAIRDNLLKVSGRIDLTMYGPGSNDQQPRRSVYLKIKRSSLVSLLQLFDAPDALQAIGYRQSTTTAPQSLAMLNNPFVIACVNNFADQLEALQLTDPKEIAQEGFRRALGREPLHEEIKACTELLKKGGVLARRDFCQMLFCLNEFMYIQ